MDLDVIGGSVNTLTKNGYKILEDQAFQRSLRTYGVAELRINHKSKAKQTETTQRFKLRLVNEAGEEFPTKVEFSRRDTPSKDEYELAIIGPEVARGFKRMSFGCYHYRPQMAVIQKILALAGRTETQARDVFDLHLLYLQGHLEKEQIKKATTAKVREKAMLSLGNLDYADYEGQVIEYLVPQERDRFKSKSTWESMIEVLLGVIE